MNTLIQTSFNLFILCLLGTITSVQASTSSDTKFKYIPTQFIAVLGDPHASAGGGAETWGFWPVDPGPRGVGLKDYDQLVEDNGIAHSNWKLDQNDWWLDENGILMENPKFPISPGKYVVTGDRKVMSVLTIHSEDDTGDRRWELDYGATLYDVTHLPCRSARYSPIDVQNSCLPGSAKIGDFPVSPGENMPVVKGCSKLDYAVLFIIGVAVED
ncbi:MAG: hypothetical protein ACI845_000022 [Gammaproteobacteria bacterium]|jgi:hypothetical protein